VMGEESTVGEASEADEQRAADDVSSVYIQLLLLYVAPSLFCLISIVGVIGNSFVIYVIASTPHMRSSATNILLLNLAVADLYFLIVCAPFMAYKYATVSWPFGDLACKLVGFSTYTSSYVTVYTLVAISALRYLRFCPVVCAGFYNAGGYPSTFLTLSSLSLTFLPFTILSTLFQPLSFFCKILCRSSSGTRESCKFCQRIRATKGQTMHIEAKRTQVILFYFCCCEIKLLSDRFKLCEPPPSYATASVADPEWG